MMTVSGLFEIDLYQIDELVPGEAALAVDPIGQVVAVISVYLPEGFGSSLSAWQETAYLRADFAREVVELVRVVEGDYSVEGEWELDVHDDDVREYLLLTGGDQPDERSFAALIGAAPSLHITPPDPSVRQDLGGERAFGEGVSAHDWHVPH